MGRARNEALLAGKMLKTEALPLELVSSATEALRAGKFSRRRVGSWDEALTGADCPREALPEDPGPGKTKRFVLS